MSKVEELKDRRIKLMEKHELESQAFSRQIKALDSEIEREAKTGLEEMAKLRAEAIASVEKFNSISSDGTELALLVSENDPGEREWGDSWNSDYLVRGSKNPGWFPSTYQC